MSDNDNEWEMEMIVDLVEVGVTGPEREAVSEEFQKAVEEAFKRYDDHVKTKSGGGLYE